MGIRSSHAVIAITLGLLLSIAGAASLSRVGELADRTTQAIATVDATTLIFSTLKGKDFTVPLVNDCKRAPLAGRGCIERFRSGDEVLIWYDIADPKHVWQGSTPGGGSAILLLYGGLTMATFGVVTLWFTSGLAALLMRTMRLSRRRT